MLQYQMGFQRMYFKVVSSELWSNDNMIKNQNSGPTNKLVQTVWTSLNNDINSAWTF